MIRMIARWIAFAANARVVDGCAIAGSPKTNVVLVHCAWMGASSWDKVASDLRSRGYDVTAVELPGHGKDSTPRESLSLAGYIDAIAKALPVRGKTVLVGHSIAGMVISGVAERVPARIATLVCVAVYLPRNGQSLHRLSAMDAESHVAEYWSQENTQAYSPASISNEGIVEVFGADANAADQVFFIANQKVEATASLDTRIVLTAANFDAVPRVHGHATQDNAVSYSRQKATTERVGGEPRCMRSHRRTFPCCRTPGNWPAS